MSISLFRRSYQAIATFILAMGVSLFGATSAWATEATSPGEDATTRVTATETNYQWFNWLGWAFLGLTLFVIAFVLFAWYKSVIEPKYRGRKVAQ